jgi:hypothetical protein
MSAAECITLKEEVADLVPTGKLEMKIDETTCDETSSAVSPSVAGRSSCDSSPMMTLPYPPACPGKIQQMESAGVLPQEPVAYAMMSADGKPLSLVINNPNFADRSMWVDENGALKLCIDTRHISYNYVPSESTTSSHPSMSDMLPSFPEIEKSKDGSVSEVTCSGMTFATSMANLTSEGSEAEPSAEELCELIQGDWFSSDGTRYNVTGKKVIVTRLAKPMQAAPPSKSFDLSFEDGQVYWGFKMSYFLSCVNLDTRSCQWSPSDGSSKSSWEWSRVQSSDAAAGLVLEYIHFFVYSFASTHFSKPITDKI